MSDLTRALVAAIDNSEAASNEIREDINALYNRIFGIENDHYLPFNPNASDNEKMEWARKKLSFMPKRHRPSDFNILYGLYESHESFNLLETRKGNGYITVSLISAAKHLVDTARTAYIRQDNGAYVLDTNRLSQENFKQAIKHLRDWAAIYHLFKKGWFIGKRVSVLPNVEFDALVIEKNPPQQYNVVCLLLNLLLLPIQLITCLFVRKWLVQVESKAFQKYKRFSKILDKAREKPEYLEELDPIYKAVPFYRKSWFWHIIAASTLGALAFGLSIKGCSLLGALGANLGLTRLAAASIDGAFLFLLSALVIGLLITVIQYICFPDPPLARQENRSVSSKHIENRVNINRTNGIQQHATLPIAYEGNLVNSLVS